MKIAVLCEVSGRVREAFLKKGHAAVSCDLRPTDIPGPHIQGDICNYFWGNFDMVIAFPPCTFLTCSANRWLYHPEDKNLSVDLRRRHPLYPNRLKDQKKAVNFVKYIWNLPVEKICIENPVGVLSTQFLQPSQYIHPYMFGDKVKKRTCLWLKNLPPLIPTNIVQPEIIKKKTYTCPSWMNVTGGHEKYSKIRSITYQGVADAMANQWG